MTIPAKQTLPFIASPPIGTQGLAVLVLAPLKADNGQEFLPGNVYGFSLMSAVSLLLAEKGRAHVHDEEAMTLWFKAFEEFDEKYDQRVSKFFAALGFDSFEFPREITLESAPQVVKFIELFTGPFRKVLGEKYAEKVEKLIAEGNAKLDQEKLDAEAKAAAEAKAKAEAEAAKLAAEKVDPKPHEGSPTTDPSKDHLVELLKAGASPEEPKVVGTVDAEKQVPVEAKDTVSSADVEKPSEEPAPTPPPPAAPSRRGRR